MDDKNRLPVITIIVPCYNEQDTLPVLYENVNRVLAETGCISTWEYIFVDDGSTDNTLQVIKSLSVQDGRIHCILFSRNFGKEAALLSLPERNRFSKGIFPWIGFKTKWFEYKNVRRVAGASKWSFWKLFVYSLDGIIAFSTKPLALASLFGILLFLVSLGGTVAIVIRKLVLQLPNTGWSSLVCIILFVSGIQLFTIGILGQYFAKTYTEIKQRPHYIIKEEW